MPETPLNVPRGTFESPLVTYSVIDPTASIEESPYDSPEAAMERMGELNRQTGRERFVVEIKTKSPR